MSIIARWCYTARFGMKTESINHLKLWVDKIGSQAGCNWENTRIITGSIGTLESHVEMELTLDSITHLDNFFSKIPGIEHVLWGKEMSKYITDGTTRWEVLRIKKIN
jgi:hypothetical protein